MELRIWVRTADQAQLSQQLFRSQQAGHTGEVLLIECEFIRRRGGWTKYVRHCQTCSKSFRLDRFSLDIEKDLLEASLNKPLTDEEAVGMIESCYRCAVGEPHALGNEYDVDNHVVLTDHKSTCAGCGVQFLIDQKTLDHEVEVSSDAHGRPVTEAEVVPHITFCPSCWTGAKS